MRTVTVVLVLCGIALGQDPKPAHPKVDQDAVDKAILQGVKFLKTRADGLKPIDQKKERGTRLHELVLYTLVHAGVQESDPTFQTLLAHIMKEPLERTYLVSLQAMILEEVDRVKYQRRIAECAQFLVDNQCENGQWSYGNPVVMPDWLEDIPTLTQRKSVATTSKKKKKPGNTVAGHKQKPKVVRRIPIKQRSRRDGGGDNSNSQYAALGLRACWDAGIVIEKMVLKRAHTWWEKAQKSDGGWCYGNHVDHEAYGSMSAGALGSLCIYKYMLNKKWQRDKKCRKGVEWLAKNFTVIRNPGKQEHKPEDEKAHYFYYLYALERAGVLFGTEFFGANEWYPVGAKQLIADQESNGRWGKGVVDTCFAVLFLRRATRPLREDVATTGSKK